MYDKDYEKTTRAQRVRDSRRKRMEKEAWESRHEERQRVISLRKYRKGREADRRRAESLDDLDKLK